MERLASLSRRYSMVYRQAGPFSSALYAATQGLKNRRARHKLQPATAMAFDLWKLVLVAGGLRPDVMNRPLASFVLKPSRIFMVTDAALQGGGAVFYNKLALTTYTEQVTLGFLGGVAVSLSSLCFGEDSSYQNCAEFITKVVGLLGLAKLGVRDQTLHVIGDDMSALSWARKGRTRSALARNAVLVFVTVALELGLTIDGTDHLRGESNVVCDGLSRGKSASQVGLPVRLMLELEGTPILRQLLLLCDPATDSTSREGLRRLWLGARELAESVRRESVRVKPGSQ